MPLCQFTTHIGKEPYGISADVIDLIDSSHLGYCQMKRELHDP